MSELSSLMVNTDELSCLKTEFSSVAKLIHELILRQSELASKLRLAGVETMESWSLDKEVPSSPWSTMPSSRNRRLSMPAFLDPLDEDNITVELVNRFDPLQGRDECGEELLSHPVGSHPPPPGPGPSYASVTKSKARGNVTGPSSRTKPISPKHQRSRRATLAAPGPAKPASLITAEASDNVPTNVTQAVPYVLFPSPEYLILGDSIMRSVAVPHAICYSYSGAKILDLAQHVTSIIEHHPHCPHSHRPCWCK
ncbi:hypothetical protein AAFF_G00167260 [Aldrovandia affinis]|uniref:Uncharacterized protein n=1 Tax=Aldrovandia affinis TaxID=143900 RepID=A0AAD7RMC8_9TELE|nr:hypothetical protein AAFF_G00167260 [Aldrovandia affinis]